MAVAAWIPARRYGFFRIEAFSNGAQRDGVAHLSAGDGDLGGFEIDPRVIVGAAVEGAEFATLAEDLAAGDEVDGEGSDDADPAGALSVVRWSEELGGVHTTLDRSRERSGGSPTGPRSNTRAGIHV